MDTTKRELMNLSGLHSPDYLERIGRWSANAAASITGTIREWNRRQKTRKALLEMSDHLLKDIGISRIEALREGNKAFWKGQTVRNLGISCK
jgi:uncharacterized protein YjiS (DUF1127 family)